MGRGCSCWLILRQQKMRLCVSYFVSVFTFLVRATTMITRTGYFAHKYSLRIPEYAKKQRGVRECTPDKMRGDQTAQDLSLIGYP
jgi:hypothetical protein